jgi:hypothetical protein
MHYKKFTTSRVNLLSIKLGFSKLTLVNEFIIIIIIIQGLKKSF